MALIAAVISAYMLLLSAFALATPSIGTFGTLLTLLPAPWRDHAHLPAYGLLAYLVMWGLRRSEWPLSSAIMTGLSVTFIFGFYTELLQHDTPGRDASAADLLDDTVGALVAGAVMVLQTWVTHPSPQLAAQSFLLPRREKVGMRGILRKGMWSR